jgi:septal ring factor EnvC (AmiA/AmiB activator)
MERKKMPERNGVMPIWAWIVGAVIVIGSILYLMVQTQQRLETVQSERESAKEEVVQANARTTELEKQVANLKSELENGNAERSELQTNLDRANSEIERLKSELD